MKALFRSIREFLIHPADIRISIFNIMAVVGCTVSLFAFTVSVFNGAGFWNLAALLSCAVFAAAMLLYAKKTAHYRLCYLITIFLVFIVMFPVIFFTAGGIYSGMPIYFVFGVSYTVFLMENKTGLLLSAAEILEYVMCCTVAILFPQTVIPFESEQAVAMDIISCIIVCSVAMAVTVYFQTALYHAQQKKTEEALDEVKQQSQAKDVFLANMSHEIRTPINMILSMSEMIYRTANDAQVLEYNRKIRIFGRKLHEMIKDILDITRIRTGQTELNPAPYSLEKVVSELAMLGNEMVAQKGLTFTVQRDYEESLTLIGDREHLLQIFSNLVTNAVKYTEEGGVTLRVQAAPAEDHTCLLTVRVEDTGIGIPDAELPYIYDIFHRVNHPRSRKVEGTGIGLAIVKELTDRMGGSISAESMVGVGTTFTFVLKQAVSDRTVTERPRTDIHYIAPDCRMLAVDDNPDNLLLLKTLLGRTMLQIDTAENGIEGIRLAVSRQYDIIVLDYMMPEMDGIETLARMKQKGIQAAFIALTADAIAGTAAKMTAAGFAEYVTKPVDWRSFEQILLKYIPKEKLAFESRQCKAATPEQLAALTAHIENCELDIPYGLRRVDNSFDIYRKILLLFCSHYMNHYEKTAALFADADFSWLCLAMHNLKAQARGIGGSLLCSMAETMEQKLKQNDRDYAAAAFPLLMLQWTRTRDHAALLTEMLPDTDDTQNHDSVQTLTETAVHALQNNLWLNAREAVEGLQKQDPRRGDYEEILQHIENFEFKDALAMLQSRTENT